MARTRYYEWLHITHSIRAHASFLCNAPESAIDIITYPVPSHNHRAYAAKVICTIPQGRRIYLARVQHYRGELVALKALLRALQTITAQKLHADDKQERKGNDGPGKEQNEGRRTKTKEGIRKLVRGLKGGGGVSGFVKSMKGKRENGREVRHAEETSSGVISDVHSMGSRTVPPNTPSSDRTRVGSGRLNEDPQFRHFMRRTTAGEEFENGTVAYTTPIPVDPHTSPTPSPRHTPSNNSITAIHNVQPPNTTEPPSIPKTNTPASARYIYPPHIPPIPASPLTSRQSQVSTSQTSIAARGSSLDTIDSSPPAYALEDTLPRSPGISPERQAERQLRGTIEVGASAHTESMRQRREEWERKYGANTDSK